MDVPPSYTSRTCTKCGRTLPLDDFYVKDKKTGRLSKACKDCDCKRTSANHRSKREQRYAAAKAWRERNPDKVRAIYERHYASGKFMETQRAYRRRRRAPKKEEKAAAAAALAALPTKCCTKCGIDKPWDQFYVNQHGKHIAECKSCNRETHWRKRARNAEHYRALRREYCRAHPETYRHAQLRRRTRQSQQPTTLTREEWQDILAEQEYRCAWCQQPFSDDLPETMDHIVPVVMHGGLTEDNVQALCGPCNSRKGPRVMDFRRRPNP